MSKMLSNPVAVLIWTKIGQNAPSCTVDEAFPIFIPDSNRIINRLSNDVSFISLSNLRGGQKPQNVNPVPRA